MATRTDILDKAKEIVMGHRQEDYGTPEDNFSFIAKLWSAYLNMELEAEDVALMMTLFKVARIATGTGTEDSYIDACGYLACGGEIATK